MRVVSSIDEYRVIREQLAQPIGFVPTMGFLHAGHLSLVREAKKVSQNVVVSIFVNPTQFGPNEDFQAYPRDLERDLALLSGEGADVVWTPEREMLYPEPYKTWVNVEGLTDPLEGQSRPGHFQGVTTIVAKLFNVVQPQRAFFGQKDAQQVAVIQQMARDLNFPVDIVICPTVREEDGLAMSSRNTYLKEDERKAATILYRALLKAKAAFENGERNASRIRELMRDTIAQEPLAHIDYISCADQLTLNELDLIEQQALLSMAVYIGRTRLIDNIILSRGGSDEH